RHLLRGRRLGVAHPHLAGADPQHALAQAADPHHLPGARLPPRQRPAALADVPPGRGPRGGRGDHLRAPQGYPRRLLQAALLADDAGAAAAVVLPLHRALGRGGRHLRGVRRQRLPDLLADRLDGDPRLRHGRPARAAQLRHRPRGLQRLRLWHGARPGGDDPLRHPQHPAAVRERRAAAAASEMKFSLGWLRELAPVPAEVEVDEIARRLTGAGFHVEGVEEAEGDVVLDVDVTTNRVDAMCHLGLARELAAIFGVALREPVVKPVQVASAEAADLPRIDIAANTLCRRYVGLVIRGVTIAPSPEWLQKRLLAIGARPINNVVDVTNYVLWERGQPLHAFDLATLPDRHVIVREARDGESVRTLDGEERKLAAGMLVIADPA